MKNLTTEEFDKAPKVIQFLHISDISKIEVRNSIVNYPFAKDKWASGFTDLCFFTEVLFESPPV